jgi:hypothetical protein
MLTEATVQEIDMLLRDILPVTGGTFAVALEFLELAAGAHGALSGLPSVL